MDYNETAKDVFAKALEDMIMTPLKEAMERAKVARECKARRFYLMLKRLEGKERAATGIVFEDGTVVVRWTKRNGDTHTAFHDSMSDLIGYLSLYEVEYIDFPQ